MSDRDCVHCIGSVFHHGCSATNAFEFDEIEIGPVDGRQLAPSADRFVNFNALQKMEDSSTPAVAIGVLYVPWRL